MSLCVFLPNNEGFFFLAWNLCDNSGRQRASPPPAFLRQREEALR